MNSIRNIALGGATFLLLAGAARAGTNDMVGPVMVTLLRLAQIAAAPAMAPMALNSMSNPPDRIATARVVDNKGTTIGAVQKVDIQGGKPADVQIALRGTQQIVALDAGKLSYDVTNNVLTAALDKTQIVQLPAASPQG